MKDKDKLIIKLKAENEQLKALKCKFKEYCTCNTEKYINCLQEIKTIAECAMAKQQEYKKDFEQILDLITKAESEG